MDLSTEALTRTRLNRPCTVGSALLKLLLALVDGLARMLSHDGLRENPSGRMEMRRLASGRVCASVGKCVLLNLLKALGGVSASLLVTAWSDL